VTEPEDPEDEWEAANRADTRRAIIITVIALITVLVASSLVVLGGFRI
jgi:hypothetical protein